MDVYIWEQRQPVAFILGSALGNDTLSNGSMGLWSRLLFYYFLVGYSFLIVQATGLLEIVHKRAMDEDTF